MKENYWIIERDDINESVKEAANEFLSSKKRKAPLTVDKYRRVLESFFLACPGQLLELNSSIIECWIKSWDTGENKSKVNQTISVLKGFFNFCLAKGYIDKMPIKKKWRYKRIEHLPKYIDSALVSRVEIYTDLLSIRDRTLWEFLLSTGCRRSEVSGLNAEDVDFKSKSANVIGKRNKRRTVYFSDKCSILLKEYLQNRNTGPVFLNKYNERLSDKGIYRIIIQIGKVAGMEDNLNPHRLRHTFATTKFAKGADIVLVQKILGHKHLSSTEIYTKVLDKDIKADYNRIMEYEL